MDVPSETIILIVAVLIMAAVAYLELRYLRSKKQVKLDGNFEQDDAYNAVATTRAVAESLRQNGRDTTEADIIIYQAESAYERREFTRCRELADRARTALRGCKEKDIMNAPETPTEGEEAAGEVEESTAVPANEVRKMPANYLESKFMIDSVRDLLPGAPEGRKVEAQEALDLAEKSFSAGDYTEALKQAMRAKRTVSPAKADKPKPAAPASPRAAPPVIVERCRRCGAELGEGDEFCHACGGPKNVRLCPSCSSEASPEDAFCRRCGTKIGQ